MEYKKLGDIATYINGYAFKPEQRGSEGLPIIRIQDLTGNAYDLGYYNGDYLKKIELNDGDVLISWSASLGVYLWNRGKALLNQHIFKVVFDKVEIDKFYFMYAVEYNLDKMSLKTHGATMKHITKKDFDNVVIPYPDLDYQKDISYRLTSLKRIIEKYQEQLDLLDELIKARFVEMFGRPTDKITRYPKVKIGNLIKEGKASIKAGPFGSSLKKEFYVKKGFKIYGQEQVIKNDPTFGDYYINEDRFNSLKSCEVHAGDILISLVGTCGKTMIMPENFEPGIINPRLLKIAFDAEFIIPIYFKYFFGSDDLQKILNSASGHSTMNVVNAGMLKNVELIMAPIELQNQFASFVEEVDKSRLRELLAIKQIKLLLNDLWFLFY